MGSSDTDGSFEFSGLDPGLQPLSVLAEGYAEWSGELELTSGLPNTIDVWVQRGVHVRGTVHDEAGEPVDDAVVMVLDKPLEHRTPGQGPIEFGRAFLWPAVRSAPDGTFALPPVEVGELHLFASKGAHFWRGSSFWNGKKIAFVGEAIETVQAVTEGELVWNPTLSPGASFRGRVTFANGQPVIWVSVSATDEETGQQFTDQSTDEDGNFFIPGLRQTAYTPVGAP